MCESPNKICFRVLSQSLWESELIFMLISAPKGLWMDLLMILSSCGAICVTDKGFQCCTVQQELCSCWLECKAMESHSLHCQGITLEDCCLFQKGRVGSKAEIQKLCDWTLGNRIGKIATGVICKVIITCDHKEKAHGNRRCLCKHWCYACLLVFKGCGGGGLPSSINWRNQWVQPIVIKPIKQNDSIDW